MAHMVQLWFELIDHACDSGVSDLDYMALADRMTAWVGSLGLQMAKEQNVGMED